MTENARMVLEDCKQALSEIEDGVTGSQWRIRWVAAITLLRTVGYVLHNVDGLRDTLLRQIIDNAMQDLKQTKPQPEIFWNFVVLFRNNILKEYNISAGQGVTIRPGTLYVNLKTGYQHSGTSGPTTYSYTINEGCYKGRDQREVIQEAINWWEQHLERIDKEYDTRKTVA